VNNQPNTANENKITEITRRDIIDFLILRRMHFSGRLEITAFLNRIWDLSQMPSTDSRFNTAEGDIWQHMVNNNDWDDDYLLNTYLELNTCEDKILLKFLEETLHPVVLSDQAELSERLTTYNDLLQADGFRLVEAKRISNHPVYKAIQLSTNSQASGGSAYEVVLSYASENRLYVEAVAAFLTTHGVKIFYDKYEEVTLWGKDLSEHLDIVFRGSARYCIMFISEAYATKVWTTHERKSALAKALEEITEYILPARFDNTSIPGLRSTVGYVDLKNKTPEDLGKMILEKLGRTS
jgi:hypothetical protein